MKKDFSKGIFNPLIPNSAVHSNAVNTILTNNFLKPPGIPDSLPFIFLIGGLGLLFLLMTKKKSSRQRGLALWGLMVICIIILCCYDLLLFMLLNRIPAAFLHILITVFTIIYVAGVRVYSYSKIQIKPKKVFFPYQIKPEVQKTVEVKIIGAQDNKNIEKIFKDQFRLTRKEIDAAVILLDGKQYKEISGLLGIKESAVKTRINKIYHKCKVGNKIEFSNLVRGKLLEVMGS